jgi:hypothetical protein
LFFRQDLAPAVFADDFSKTEVVPQFPVERASKNSMEYR